MKQDESNGEGLVTISVRLPKDIAERFAALAGLEQRSMAAQLRVLINQALNVKP